MQYSVVVPIFKDGYLCEAFCAELESVMSSYAAPVPVNEAVEVIFVNDGSPDDSLDTLLQLRDRYDFVRVIDLSRNFGQHIAIACGMREARGEIVLRMNVDMQDPPAEIPKLLDVMKAGDFDLVVGQYSERRSPLVTKVMAWLYYAIFRFLTGFETRQNTSPLRAMSRRFVDAYNRLTEKSRFPQGLDPWLGFRQNYVEIEHRERLDNRSSYGFWSRLRLGVNGILYFSERPLQLVVIVGFFLAAIGLMLGAYIIFDKLTGYDYVPGYASLASLGLIALGLQLGCTGLVGVYVAKIFSEVQNRPLYLIRKSFDSKSSLVATE